MMRILVAEDDGASRLILQAVIQSFGSECILAADGRDAWDLFLASAPDVVISDWMMPRMDGMELCRRIRNSTASTRYTYFIFLSSLKHKSDVIRGMEAGADDYLSKPVDPDDLRIRLSVATRITELHTRLARQTERLEALNRELFEEGRTDSLTRLGNRRRLHEDLQVVKNYCAVLFDVDHFKLYNDLHGHVAGDEVLCRIGAEVLKICRKEEFAYRYGGEEFLLLLPEQSIQNAIAVAERIRTAIQAIALPHAENSAAPVVTISAGVAQSLEEADSALYVAKRQGRNCVRTLNDEPKPVPERTGEALVG